MLSGKVCRQTSSYVCILIFVISRNVGAYLQSELINNLNQYEVVVPSRVTREGNHVTYDIHPGHSLRRRSVDLNRTPNSDDTLHYRVKIEEKDFVLQISPNFKLTSPGFVVERMKNKFRNVTDSRFSKLSPEHRNCHYHGHVINGTSTKVAVGVCSGLHGFIHTDNDQYFIEPLLDEVRGPDGQHRHVVYKRSALSPELDPLGSVHVHKRSADDDSCGNTDFIQPEKRRKRWEQHHSHSHKSSKHHRQKRSFSTERYVETLVVVDPSMVKYHKNEHLETYVLTIMNMVAAMFHDASIGNSVNIILVRILLMEEERDELTITHHADRTLTSFCKFQKNINFKDDDHPNHHDVAVLFTRKNICSRLDEPCSTLGLAQVSGMCQPHWSCNINEDTGLALAYTVTHEIGHNFGMHHDGYRNGCEDPPGKQLFLMAPSLVADSLTKTWSNCSREAITKFIDRDWGYCLNDEPSDHDYNFPVLPPGTMYDADHQCRLQYGTADAKICTDEQDVCSNLWCRTENRCSTHLEAAAEGTICGTNKWCYQGECVKIGERPESINGEWGEWTSWSDCTRTCSGGVSHSQRHCDNPHPSHGGKYCLGERKRYRICNTEECENASKSFNQMQCEEFNFLPYKNHYYEWEHVLAADSPCQLHCKPKNRFFSSLLKDIVTDGTPCTPGTPNMCISGRCRHIGCDFVIDSTAKEDLCGVCHGDGTTCTTIKAKFTESKGLGYVEATVIPRGARNIHVNELAEANNFLALQNDKGEYYLNGHWFIQWSGSYEIAGTIVQYTRVGNKESFEAPGPLKEPLHIMLLLQSENPGVSFEYTVPKENISEPRTPQFNWIYLDWTHCTASCGGGKQRSEVVCSEIESGVVDDKYCLTDKPDDKQKVCNDYLCPARWWVGPWQHCSKTCGKDGIHQRTVICIRSMGLDEQIALEDDACDAEVKPPEIELCHKKEPCPGNSSWNFGEWSKCEDNPCGIMYRSVTCNDPAIGCDETAIPLSEMPCSNVTCGKWVTEHWSPCPVTCGMGQQERLVRCEGGEHCNYENKPTEGKVCVLEPCRAVTFPMPVSTSILTAASVTETHTGDSENVVDKQTPASSLTTVTTKPTEMTVESSMVTGKAESSLMGKKSEDNNHIIALPGDDNDNDNIEIESYDNIENKDKEDTQMAEKNSDIQIDSNIESENYKPEQENIFEKGSEVRGTEEKIKPMDDISESLLNKETIKDASKQKEKLTVKTTDGSMGAKYVTTTEQIIFSNTEENKKDNNDFSNKETHKHRHHHGDKQNHHNNKVVEGKSSLKEEDKTIDSVHSEKAKQSVNSNKVLLNEKVIGERDEKAGGGYHIVEESYNDKQEVDTTSSQNNVNMNPTSIQTNSDSDLQLNIHDEITKESELDDNLNESPNLEKLPVLPPMNSKVPELPDMSKLPAMPELKDLKPIPDNNDLKKFHISDFPNLHKLQQLPDRIGLPELPNKEQLAPLPDYKDLPELPNKEQLAPLPDYKDLPELPNKAQLPPLPDYKDLPPMPSLKNNLLPPNIDKTKNEQILQNNGNIATIPDVKALPYLPDLKDLPIKNLSPLDKFNNLPKLPSKTLVPLPGIKELPPVPDLNYLPNKDLLSPDIDKSENVDDHSANIQDANNDKVTQKNEESKTKPLLGAPLEIKTTDIANTETALPQQVDNEQPANMNIVKPVSKSISEIKDLKITNKTFSGDLPDKNDINVEIPEIKGTDTVLKRDETMKSKDEIIQKIPEKRWKPSKWTECSRGCGDGVRTRTVTCVDERDMEVHDIYCDINTKPSAIGDCFVQDCVQWRLSQWSECSTTCGYSIRYRNVVCPQEGACDQRNEPIREELCSKPDCVKWVSGQWSQCSKKCEGGDQVRLVQCVNLTSQLSSRNCQQSDKPVETQTCNTDPCKDRNAAVTIKCEHNEMSSQVCRALRKMGQCHRRFVSIKCCKTCKKNQNQKLNKERPRSRALR